ncbi:MAG: alpha/beta hydrolase [Spirochaetia bacterium]|nr:alpha/beta hydrolase [Spirochaetia bacterium]
MKKHVNRLQMSKRMHLMVRFLEIGMRKPVYAMSEKERDKFRKINIPDNILTRKIFNIPSNSAKKQEFVIPVKNGEVSGTLFLPNKEAESKVQPTPAIIYFHGGGWVLSTIAMHTRLCEKFSVLLGLPILSVEYRLAPKHKFPTAAEDAYDSLTWLHTHADEFKINRSAIYVMGSSAGGNLAAVVSLMARDRKGPEIRGQILNYPVTSSAMDTESYTLFKEGPILTKKDMEFFIEAYSSKKDDITNPYLSPMLASNHADLPEALIITAEYDPLRDEGKKYAEVLTNAGVSVTYHMCKQTIHGFLVYPGAEGIKDAERLINVFIARSTT